MLTYHGILAPTASWRLNLEPKMTYDPKPESLPDRVSGPGVRDRYDEVLRIEIDGWAHGIANYPGEVFPGLVLRVIKELAPSFTEAIKHGHAFDAIAVGMQFARAAKYVLSADEVTTAILLSLPAPSTLGGDEREILRNIIDPADQAVGDVWRRLRERWAAKGAGPGRLLHSVFISHSHRDNVECRHLKDQLEQRGVRVWMDSDELNYGDDLLAEIQRGINEIGVLLVYLTPHSAESDWVRREVELAQNPPAGGGQIRILTLRAADIAPPKHLTLCRWIDFTAMKSEAERLSALLAAITGDPDYRRDKPEPIRLPSVERLREQDLLQNVPRPKGLEQSFAQTRPRAFTDTTGWTHDRILATIERNRVELGWPHVHGSAKQWWMALESENRHRPDVVLRLTEELLIRGASITQFFLAYVYSNTDNILANLHYLDYLLLRQQEELRRKEPKASPSRWGSPGERDSDLGNSVGHETPR